SRRQALQSVPASVLAAEKPLPCETPRFKVIAFSAKVLRGESAGNLLRTNASIFDDARPQGRLGLDALCELLRGARLGIETLAGHGSLHLRITERRVHLRAHALHDAGRCTGRHQQREPGVGVEAGVT